MCCNQKRSALQSPAAVTRPVAPARQGIKRPFIGQSSFGGARVAAASSRAAALPLASSAGMAVRYTEQAPLRVRGPVTGRSYDFTGSRPEQPVDRRDLSGLLSTGLFQVKG